MRRTLKAEREKKGLTLAQLETLSGVHKATISRLERGDTLPMLGTAQALEAALGLKRGSLDFAQRQSGALA